jgi:hypothetical protein
VSSRQDGLYRRYAADYELLRQIGQTLRRQHGANPALLPTGLADAAVSAWHRVDSGQPADPESPVQARLRAAAGTLALIGLEIEQHGMSGDGTVSIALSPAMAAEAVAASRREPNGE